jgi:Flp pilus assembly protein CpaB
VAVAVAAILAFVANVAFLRASDSALTVVASARDLPAGHVLSDDDLTTTEVRADASVLSVLLTTVEGLQGRVVRTPLPQGTLVGRADLLVSATPDGLVSMSVPISPAHAAGGTIRVGDIVSVVDVGPDDEAACVVRGVTVVAVSEPGGGALDVAGSQHVVLGLDESDVLAMAAAIADGSVDVVVTTGSVDG